MIGFLGRFLYQNSDVTYFVCGLTYMVLGVSVLVKPRQKSSFSLSHIIGLLSGFAIFYGINEWLKMWAVIKGHSIIIEVMRAIIILVSYILLFEFARRLLFITERSSYGWRRKTAILFNWWLPLAIELYIVTVVILSFDLWNIPRIWSGYLLGFPGGILISLGFLYYYRDEKYLLEPLGVKKYFIGASLSFLALSILEGLIVPKGNFFPANLLNTESFYAYFKIPVQVFRAICAIVATRSVTGILTIFDLETVNRLEETKLKLSDELEERKRAEVRIEKAYILNRMILEKAPFGILLINDSGNIDYVNPSMINISGDTYEELKGLNVFEHPGYKRIGLEQKVRNVLTSGESFFMGPMEYTAHYSGKKTIRNFSGILLEEGLERKALVFIEDITERKQAEKALGEKEEEYHTLVDNLNIGVYRNTAGPEGCFLQANPAMVKMFGYDSVEEFMKINVSDLYEDPRDRLKFVEKINKEGIIRGMELRLRKKNGIPIWASVNAKPQLDERGEIKWMDGVIEDISERKSAEILLRNAYMELKETQQELIQTEKFAALGRFSSGLAHEIKNPLAIVLGGAEFLELKLNGADEDVLLA
ncbi:MAG: PAS domain S-box protein, partial [Candidatus Omnitrophica bacterium]|nr:PAS domain S-box protein [Candidatus Omnitrophota bacterium]